MRVILHMGFHKTATSYLQRLFNINRDRLMQNGGKYVVLPHLRDNFTWPCGVKAHERLGIRRNKKLTDAELRKKTGSFFKQILSDAPETLILSDENMIGVTGHCVQSGELYHFRKEFLAVVSEELPFEVSEIYLSVRNYADFFAAAYFEYLILFKGDRFVTEDQMKMRVFQQMPNWADPLEDVAARFPKAKIHIWRYEDFRKILGTIVQSICGSSIDASLFRMPALNIIRPSGSNKTMQEFRKIFLCESPQTALLKLKYLHDKYPKGEKYSKYIPWSNEEYKSLVASYEQHWAQICRNPNYTILSPDQLARDAGTA